MDNRIYNQIIKEYFDITDRDTRKTLISLNEADQNQMIVSLSTKLYNMIVAKVDDIDYGKIPESRGDITKIPNFIELNECLDTIRKLLIEYKQSTEPADIINEAIENLKDSKEMWEKAFTLKSELPIVFYNTIALSIVSSVSFLISGSIDLIRDPANESYQMVLDTNGYHRSKDYLLFKDLKNFNISYKKGEIEKVMKALLDANRAVRESYAVNEIEAVSVIAGVIASYTLIQMLKLVLPILQELVALLYCARQNVSDYFSIQSDIVRLNAENVKLDTTKTASERNKIYKKQIKIADTFKKIANKLSVKIKSSEKEAKKLVEKENKTNFKANDVLVTAPSGSTSSIF